MTRVWKLCLTASVLAAAAACGPPPATPTDSGAASDAATPPADAAPPPDAPPAEDTPPVQACENPIPGADFGSEVGANVRPFELTACEGETPVMPFYDQSYCSSQVTVMVIAAGWCVPCMAEAPMIEELITQAYSDRGVRVLTVIGQNPNYGPPTTAFCLQWKQRYGLTSTMAIDVEGRTLRYFPNMAFPANLVINRNGQITFRQYGSQTGLADLQAAVEDALAAR